ncbi:MAG: AraC family transcriptional regulator [Bacteroidales bacterium]|nr:AraC family transcriptional regulator [Bacteroidales bacterium]
MDSLHLKYLAVNPVDLLWGTAVNSVGYQLIAPGSDYPPRNHPSRYIFTPESGRVLHEYQLLYITEGRGKFCCETLGRSKATTIESGNMFLLFPGEWHSYHPDKQTGWKEYWIGFNGSFIDNIVKHEFFSKDKPIFNVNIHEDIVGLYNSAISAAIEQESGFQQILAGIVDRLLSLAYFYDRNTQFQESDTANKIGQAKVMIQDNYMNISPEEIASKLCLSYSSFRKTFKEYTGFSPARFINLVRMSKAKELLTNTTMSIKEVAYHVGYNNHDYFFTAFRHMTGRTPAEYRSMTQNTKP